MREVLIEPPPVRRRLNMTVPLVNQRGNRVYDPALTIPGVKKWLCDIHTAV
jgi:hypothetical protein